MSDQRPPWKVIHMEQARVLKARSTCIRIQTAAIIVSPDNRIKSSGYNGTGPGSQHCCDYWHDRADRCKTDHHEWSVKNEIHAEQNSILWAAAEGIPTRDTTMYTIYSPCINCAKSIHAARIIAVYYDIKYDRDEEGINYLRKNGIICQQYME